MENSNNNQNEMKDAMSGPGGMYRRLILMTVTMFIIMFFIMYSMIDSTKELIFNLNNVYMTLLMTTAMVIIEIIVMKKMYANKKINLAVLITASALMIFSWFGIREQIGVGNREFIKGMIPHHSAALLMSKKAKISDPELLILRDSILSTQQQEINFMESKLQKP